MAVANEAVVITKNYTNNNYNTDHHYHQNNVNVKSINK